MAIADYTDEEVANWMQGKRPEEVAQQAAQLGLNANQIQEAYNLGGQQVSLEDIGRYVDTHGYRFDDSGGMQAGNEHSNAQRVPTGRETPNVRSPWGGAVNSQLWNFETNRPVYLGNATSATDPSQQLSVEQIRGWFDQNPNASNEQLAEMAARYHMTPENVAQSLAIGRGDAYNPQGVRDWLATQDNYLVENDGMISAPGHRSSGMNGVIGSNRPFGQYGADGLGFADSSGVPYGSTVGTNPGNAAGGSGGSGGSSSPTSFVGSNGQTYTQQQVNDWYAQKNATSGRSNRDTFGADIDMINSLGLIAPDLYKGRQLAGMGDGTGIYTDPKEYAAYAETRKGSPVSRPGVTQSFDTWRAEQDPNSLAALQKGMPIGMVYPGMTPNPNIRYSTEYPGASGISSIAGPRVDLKTGRASGSGGGGSDMTGSNLSSELERLFAKYSNV